MKKKKTVEAQVRSVAPIGRVRAELRAASHARIRVDIDVEAKVFEQATRPARKAEGGAKRTRAS